MGWSNAAPRTADNQITHAQRMEIIRIREQIDGVSPGTYAGDHVAAMDKHAAGREIDRLKLKLGGRKAEVKCPFCFKLKPCGCVRSRS